MIVPWRNEKLRQAYERPVIKASIEIVLSIFAVVILLFFAIRTTLATVATLQKKIDDQSVVDLRLTTKIGQLSRAQTDLANNAGRISDFTAAVPDSPDQGGVTKRIEVLSKENHLVVNTMALDSVPIVGQLIDLANKDKGASAPTRIPGTNIATFKINFDISGNQDGILSFVSQLENMDRVVMINNIDMKKVEEKAPGVAETVRGVRAVGTGTAYYVLSNTQ